MQKFFLCLLLFYLPGPALAQRKPVVITDFEQQLLSRDYFMIKNDAKGDLNIMQMLHSAELHPSERFLPAFGVNNSVVWVKFAVSNQSDKKDLSLTIDNTVIDAVDLYEATGQFSYTVNHYSSSRRQGVQMRGLFSQQKPVIRFSVTPGANKVFYLRIEGSEPVVLPIYLSTRETYLQNRITEDIAFGGFLGILTITIFFNLFIYFILRDKSYIYYVSYTLFLSLSQFILRGYGTAIFFSGFYEINNLILPIIRSITGISILLFVFEFLQVEDQIKNANRYFYVGFLCYVIPIVLALSGSAKPAYFFLNINALVLSISLMTLGGILYRRGFKPSRFFLIGWGLFFVIVLITLAKNNGIIPYRHFLDNLILYANAIQSILFSVALADKISFYRDQKNESRELALHIARENERLIVSQNQVLEREVKQRTRKLRETNQDLETLLDDLRTAQTALVENEKMASLGQLTAGVAHEINNPINYVGANVKPLRMDVEELLLLLAKYRELEKDPQNEQTLQSIMALKKQIDIDLLESEISTLLDGIEDGAQRTSEIVKSLRTFSRVDEQALKFADVNAGIRDTLVLLRQAMPDYIRINMQLGELPLINCYPGKLNQVYMNLFNNSIHSIIAKTAHNGEYINIETKNLEDDVLISITDTGTGMTDEVQKRIFEPFFTTKEVGEGTGLGMSIVFGIMEKHRGSIDVNSAPGRGTTISLRIPKNLQEG